MDWNHQLIGSCGYDDTAILALTLHPQTSKAKNLFPLDLDTEGSFARLPFLPLKEEAGWNDTALELEGFLERLALSETFRTSVDQLPNPLLVLGPSRREPPPHQLQRVGAV